MTQTTGNDEPRVIEGIKQAIGLDSMGETESAVRQLLALAEELPAAASLHGYIGLFLIKSGDLGGAIEHGHKATRLSPKSEKASLVLFEGLSKAERYVEALDEAKRFLALKPSEEYTKLVQQLNLSEDASQAP